MQIFYEPKDSLLYSLHPIVKGLVALLAVFFFSLNRLSVLYSLFVLLIFIVIAQVSSVPILNILLSLKKILVLILFVGAVQGFSAVGFDYLAAFEAIIRVIGVFITAAIFVSVSSQSELLFFWEKVFSPLRLLGLPSSQLALIMVIAVRFLPVIMSEIERIKMAQIARGANFAQGKSIIVNARVFMPLLVPTLSQAIIRAGELALAMEARGYKVSAQRSSYYVFRLKAIDYILLILAVLLFSTIFL